MIDYLLNDCLEGIAVTVENLEKSQKCFLKPDLHRELKIVPLNLSDFKDRIFFLKTINKLRFQGAPRFLKLIEI